MKTVPETFRRLGSNIGAPSPYLKPPQFTRGYWVEVDQNDLGHLIPRSDNDTRASATKHKCFDSVFEAQLWLKGYELRGRYLGHGTLEWLLRKRREQ